MTAPAQVTGISRCEIQNNHKLIVPTSPSGAGRRRVCRAARWLGLLAVLLSASAHAETTLSGRLEQGGIALGRAEAGSAVSLDGRGVPVDADGRFLLGFGREAAPEAVLEVRHATGAVETRRLTVAKRPWPVQRIDGLAPDKVTPDPRQLARIKAEAELVAVRRSTVSLQPLFLSGLAPPADGPVSGVFGSQRILNGEPRAAHSGTDIAAPAGATVRAVADGVVVLAAPDLFFTGRTVMIDHGLGLQSVYAHLSAILVAEGSHVKRGEAIGRVGASGRATGPHLHWGASWLDVRLDPETVLAVLRGD
jgi:murein DD-endopeptidase MepM/ murein hydrolase activator NlpD